MKKRITSALIAIMLVLGSFMPSAIVSNAQQNVSGQPTIMNQTTESNHDEELSNGDASNIKKIMMKS